MCERVMDSTNRVESEFYRRPIAHHQYLNAQPRFNNGNLVQVYRDIFNTEEAGIRERYDALDLQIAKLTEAWLDLPSQRAKEHAKARLEGLEAQLAELGDKLKNHATAYERSGQELCELTKQFEDAFQTLTNSDSPDRQKGEAVRQVISRINATFSAGNVEIEIIPVDGDARKYSKCPNGAGPGDC